MRDRLIFLSIALLLGSAFAGCISGGESSEGEGPDGEQEDGDDATVPVSVQWGDVASAVLRPGASYGGFCTFNWLFSDAAGNAYAGTAAHCTELRERASVGGHGEVGTVVYDSDETTGADALVDFSLILIDPESVPVAHPRMLGQEGPNGVAEDAAPGDLLAIHGHGMVLGEQDQTRDRVGVLVQVDEREYRANMPAVWGDSGAPVLHVDTGAAFGIISRFGVEPPLPTTDVGPLLPWILDELAKAGFDVELATG